MSTSATYAVNLPLTNYIIGWYGTQTHDPARFLAPGVKAPGLLTTYKRYLRQDAFAASDTRRPMYDSPRTIDIRGEDVPVMLEVSIHAPVWVRRPDEYGLSIKHATKVLRQPDARTRCGQA